MLFFNGCSGDITKLQLHAISCRNLRVAHYVVILPPSGRTPSQFSKLFDADDGDHKINDRVRVPLSFPELLARTNAKSKERFPALSAERSSAVRDIGLERPVSSSALMPSDVQANAPLPLERRNEVASPNM